MEKSVVVCERLSSLLAGLLFNLSGFFSFPPLAGTQRSEPRDPLDYFFLFFFLQSEEQ